MHPHLCVPVPCLGSAKLAVGRTEISVLRTIIDESFAATGDILGLPTLVAPQYDYRLGGNRPTSGPSFAAAERHQWSKSSVAEEYYAERSGNRWVHESS